MGHRFLENPQSLQEIATGAGKTITTATLAQLCEKNGRTIVIVPNKDLVTQTEEDFINCGLDVGVYFGDRKMLGYTHTICTWQSLNVLDKKSKNWEVEDALTLAEFLDGVKAVIVDEVHMAKADVLKNLLTQNLANAVTGCGTSALRDDKLVYQISMENTLNDYNLINMSWVGPVNGITENFYDLAQDPVSGNLYASSTDFFSTGKIYVFAPDNTEINQFNTGVSPGTIVFDVRSSAGLPEVTSMVSVAPNPCQDLIQINGLTHNTSYLLTNAEGKTLLKGTAPSISLQQYCAGVYYLHVNNSTVKIIKQ